MNCQIAKRETRFRYEPLEEAPEGWRWLRNEFNDRGFFALWTEAPEGESAHGRPNKWITLRQIVQERFVTEWADTDETRTEP